MRRLRGGANSKQRRCVAVEKREVAESPAGFAKNMERKAENSASFAPPRSFKDLSIGGRIMCLGWLGPGR